MKRLWEDDELAAEWTLEPNDQTLLANKAGPTRLGFAALLIFFRREGRFPTSKHEVPPAVVRHLASQLGVPAEAYVATTGAAARSSTTAFRSETRSVSARRVSRMRTTSSVGWRLMYCRTSGVWIACGRQSMRTAASCASNRPRPSASSVWSARQWPTMSGKYPRRYVSASRPSRSRRWTAC